MLTQYYFYIIFQNINLIYFKVNTNNNNNVFKFKKHGKVQYLL